MPVVVRVSVGSKYGAQHSRLDFIMHAYSELKVFPAALMMRRA